jgi:hypothetical protein
MLFRLHFLTGVNSYEPCMNARIGVFALYLFGFLHVT